MERVEKLPKMISDAFITALTAANGRTMQLASALADTAGVPARKLAWVLSKVFSDEGIDQFRIMRSIAAGAQHDSPCNR